MHMTPLTLGQKFICTVNAYNAAGGDIHTSVPYTLRVVSGIDAPCCRLSPYKRTVPLSLIQSCSSKLIYLTVSFTRPWNAGIYDAVAALSVTPVSL
jgi:hypothetical protein